jgi:hypothetical protein
MHIKTSLMKRLLILALLLTSAALFAQHPTDKGWRSVGGTGNLRFDLDGDDSRWHSFSLSPEMYFFIGNSFAVGADFGFSLASARSIDSMVILKARQVNLWVAPGLRFYMRDPEKAWRPYLFANAGYQYSAVKYTVEQRTGTQTVNSATVEVSGFRAYGGAGLAWFFSDHAAFDIRMRALDYYPQSQNNMELSYSPVFMIGVQAFFD